MDRRRFDDLLRSFATDPASRRSAMKGLLGGAAAGGLALFGFDAAAAACVRPGRRCGGTETCCRGAACKGGRCRCKAGLTKCGNRCRNLKSDRANCGRCGKVCGRGQTCANGVCKASGGGGACPSGKKRCNGACIPAGNCCADGECGDGETCQDGACVGDPGPTCPSGQKDCDGTCQECCGNGDCGGGKRCESGTCRCPSWLQECGGSCYECCGNVDCGPGGACNNGVCSRPPLVEEQADEVGFGKRIETKARLYENDQLVAQVRTVNSSWVAGLRGRVLIVAVDERERAIWVSETIEARTRCSVPDISCASEGVETFTQAFPAHPEAGNVIRKHARRLDIYHSDGPSPITFPDRWRDNIRQAQDIAREIKELATIVWGPL